MTEIAVYDTTGEPRSLTWALDKYGPFLIYPAEPRFEPNRIWRLTALREKNDAAFIATTRSQDREPQPGVRVCFYWPDAPTLQEAGPLGAPFPGITPNRAVSGYTDIAGHVGFGMGPGAQYDAASGERGPHAAWIYGANTRSDVILGLGMIPDDHLHLNAEWTLIAEEPNSDEDLVALLRQLVGTLRTIADILEGNANA